MKRDRAYIRFQRERAWNKAKRIVKDVWGYNERETKSPHSFEQDTINLINHLYKNRHPCSCYMCGHRRDLIGPTPQELKQGNYEDELGYL